MRYVYAVEAHRYGELIYRDETRNHNDAAMIRGRFSMSLRGLRHPTYDPIAEEDAEYEEYVTSRLAKEQARIEELRKR